MTNYVASYHQERLWFVHEFEKGKLYVDEPVYFNMDFSLIIEAPIKPIELERAAQLVVAEQEILRTVIVLSDGGPVQEIKDVSDQKIWWQSKCSSRQKALADAWEIRDIPFSLERPPLIRFFLAEVNDHEFVFSIIIHHAIGDRFSLRLIADRLFSIYKSIASDSSIENPQPMITYGDFATWQKSFSPEAMEELIFYWTRKLKHWETLYFPTDFFREPVHIYKRANCSLEISGTDILKSNSKHGIAPNIFFFSVFNFLLYRYTYQSHVTCGYSVPYRNDDFKTVVGPIANLLVFCTKIDPSKSFMDLLQSIKRDYEEYLEKAHLPFDCLAEAMHPEKDMSRCALFDVLFNYERLQTPETRLSENVTCVEINSGTGKYDLNLLVTENDYSWNLTLTYNKLLFEESSMIDFLSYFNNSLSILVHDYHQKLKDISLPLLQGSSNDCPLIKTSELVVDFLTSFHKRVTEYGNSVALHFDDRNISYVMLDQMSSQMAKAISSKHGNLTGEIVSVLIEPSEKMIAIAIALFKLGAAYVPLDPEYPEARINFILQESNCPVVITSDALRFKIDSSASRCSIVSIESLLGHPSTSEQFEDHTNLLSSPAYVIYTSGTTGKPKGCVVSHNNLATLLHNSKDLFQFNENDTWLLAHSFAFDFSVWEIFGALASGARLIIPSRKDIINVETFAQVMIKGRVSVLNITPSAFYALKDILLQDDAVQLPDLRTVIFGGEKLDFTKLKDWVQRFSLKDIQMVNMYGITETTVHVTHYRIVPEDVFGKRKASVIGMPLPGVSLYIFDQWMNPVPNGVSGEFYVGGTGVSLGYLNNPELTAERFIKNPQNEGEILYRTGDTGRWISNGKAAFHSRNDRQIKIRGFRIEKNEIESAILKTGMTDEVVVVQKKTKNDQEVLMAYYTGAGPLDADQLRRSIAKEIPLYMMPDQFIYLPKFPLTTNGKINENVLPPPREDDERQWPTQPGSAYTTILTIWQRILGKVTIGPNDNFFYIGGNSLKVVKVWIELNKFFPGKIDLQDLFENVTISDLSEKLSDVSALVIDEESHLQKFSLHTPSANEKYDLFFIPPSSGLSYCYQPMLSLLPKKVNACFLNFHGIIDGGPIFATLDALVKTYAKQIVSTSKSQRPILFGYSSGGNMAFEITKEISSLGTDPVLIMVDTKIRQDRELFEAELSKDGGVKEEIFKTYHDIIQDMEISLKDYHRKSEFLENYKEVIWNFYKYWKDYTTTAGSVACTSLLFTVGENYHYMENWKPYCGDDLQIIQLPSGQHNTIFDHEDNLQTMAQFIEQNLFNIIDPIEAR